MPSEQDAISERDVMDANEHLDYQREEDAGHIDGLSALADEQPAARFEEKRFEITDAGGANWYLKKLRNLENEKATIKAQTEAMLKALDADIHRLEFLYGRQFETWVRAELAQRGGRSKSVNLHQGTAAFRTVAATLRVRSAAEALTYAREQGWNLVKTVESLDADGYKKQAAAVRAETGEVLPGIEVTEDRESFTIRWGKSNDDQE